jgi:hypothetical protein
MPRASSASFLETVKGYTFNVFEERNANADSVKEILTVQRVLLRAASGNSKPASVNSNHFPQKKGLVGQH